MAKVSKKSEKITAFGGIFFVLDKFDSILSSVIDTHLGLRSTLIGYQYSEIIRAIFSVFCCGGDCMEDLNLVTGGQHAVRLCVTNDSKTDASQTNQLSDTCTILFGFAKYVITTLSIV